MRKTFFFILITTVFVISCEDHSKHQTPNVAKDTASNAQTMASMPGMEPVKENHSEMLQLSSREQLLVGIKIDTVRMKNIQLSLTVLGEVATDESTVAVISARVNGRIDKLYLRNPGEEIHNGEALYDIYSETIYAEEMDLIQLIQNAQSTNLIGASRNKLMLQGLTAKQIAEIEKNKTASPSITFYSSVDGFLTSLPVREGQYVGIGDALFEVGSLNVVRINAQVYPDEIISFDAATDYIVETGTSNGKNYAATKAFGNPSLETNSKIQFVRLRVINTDHVLRPGMMTTIKAMTKAKKSLVIPKTALIAENGMTFIWTMEKDGMFSRHMIQTGMENENEVVVISGLTEGEQVVASGSYLLNSEYILRKGANAMGGMKM